jgi:hypothetical protein
MMTSLLEKIETAPLAGFKAVCVKAAPLAATSSVLLLARAADAEHNTGDAVIVGALAVGMALGGLKVADASHGDKTTTAMTLTAAATLGFAGVAAYSDGWGLPLLLWSVSTVLAYVFTNRYWREDRRAGEVHRRRMQADRARHQHKEAVEAMRASAAVETARLELASADAGVLAATRLAEVLYTHRPQLPSQAAPRTALAAAIEARATLPGFDAQALLIGTATTRTEA